MNNDVSAERVTSLESEFHQQSWLWLLGLLGELCVMTGPLKVAKFSQGFSSVQH